MGMTIFMPVQDDTRHRPRVSKFGRVPAFLGPFGDMVLGRRGLKIGWAARLRGGTKISMLTSQVENFRGKFASLEHFGRIIRGPEHKIVGIVVKDASKSSTLKIMKSTGIYMFNTKWLWKI